MCHVNGVVEDDNPAVAHHRAGGGERFVIHRQIELLGRQVRTERPTDLDGPHRPPGTRAAAVPLDEIAQGNAKGGLDDAATGDVPGQLENLSSARAPDAVFGERFRSVSQNHRNRAQREHVVDYGRLAEKPVQRRNGWLRANHAALALQTFQHRGLFAADVRSGADSDDQLKGKICPEHARAQPAVRVRDIDRLSQGRDRVRILGPYVDVALGRADRICGDGHAPR